MKIYTAYELVNIRNREIENWPAPGVDVVKYADHEQALAEKNRELELADFTIKECLKKILQQDKAYQQLMEKAVRFAMNVRDADGYVYDPEDVYYAAQAFLKEREGA